MAVWNPWHGCKKLSPGCENCYVYRRDAEFGKDASVVKKTAAFDAPVKKNRKGEYKMQDDGDYVYACMTSDFFLEQADEWRPEAWEMIKERSDLRFFIITKRIHRFRECIPADWGEGYDNVTICCTCENQNTANCRLPIFVGIPIKHRKIIHEPMLEAVDIEEYLATGLIESVTCGGESGEDARVCDFGWIINTMNQCVKYDVPFYFKQTGARFKKGDKIYNVDRKDQMSQARKAGVDYIIKMDIRKESADESKANLP